VKKLETHAPQDPAYACRTSVQGKALVKCWQAPYKRLGLPQKIAFSDMRDMGVCGLLIYCTDHKCSHLITISGDRWPDNIATVRSRAAVCLLSLRQAWRGCQARLQLE
jgi:hypothetical protein